MRTIERQGWFGRLMAATVTVALILPGPAQAWAQAQANERDTKALAKHVLQALSRIADTSSEPLEAPPAFEDAGRAVSSPSEVLPAPLLPKKVQWISGNGPNTDAWQLFDGNPGSAPSVTSSEPMRFAVDLQEPRSLAAITIQGPTDGTLSLFAQDGLNLRPVIAAQSIPVHAGLNEWKRVPIADAALGSRFVVQWLPTSASGPSEIGLWARWLPPRDATDVELADRILASSAPGALVARAIPDRVTAARVSLGGTSPSNGVVHVQLSADPRSWSRAFLVYELTGLGHFTQAVRQINGLTARGGVQPARSEGGLQVEEISPEWLKVGDNEVRFLPLPEAGAPDYSVQRVRILATAHGSLGEARMNGSSGGAGSAPQSIGFDGVSKAHDLVFEQLRPSNGHLLVRATGSGVSRAPLRVDLLGRGAGWHHVSLDSLSNATGVDVSVDRAAQAAHEGELSAVSEVLVTASPITSEADTRAVAISYPLHGECRNHEAWVTGFVAAQGEDVVGLRVDRQDSTSALAHDKSFALHLVEPAGKAGKAWTANLEATLASGKVVRHTLKFEPCLEDAQVADRTRTEDAGAPYSQLVRAGEKKTITFAGAKLEIPAGAVDHDVRISVRPLVADQVEQMSPRVANVSPGQRAYRFGPHGLKFKKPVKLTLPYDAAALKQGQSEREIFAFYYDEPLGSWQRIGRYDTARAGALTSLTEHFTDFISGVMAMPDEPGVKSFSSNEIKGIKVGAPAAGVNLIAPPEPNSSGSMNLQYPIEVPPGRNGIEPSLAFTYSSDRPNGWMGVGWDIRLPTIEVDTKFGVPRYDEFTYGERDRYLIDGQELVPTTPASNGTPASDTYVRRIEGPFERIVRNVDTSNCVTSWTVTDKQGRVATYGGSGAVLAQTDPPSTPCKVSRWGLASLQDTFGNRMEVKYDTVSGTLPGSSGGAEPFVQLYPRQIDYTAHYAAGSATPDLAAAYRVSFVRDAGNRPDVIVSGRSGFQERTSHRLDHVDVQLLNGTGTPTLIRRYKLTYEAPSFSHFYKSLLSSIGQQGLGAVMQLDQHTFQYGGVQTTTVANNVRAVDGFAPQAAWGTAQNGSALSRTEDTMGGGSGTLGIGLPIISFSVTAGANGGSEKTTLSLIDFNGDGLPDLGSSGGGAFMNFLRPDLAGVSSPDLTKHFYSQSLTPVDSHGHTNKSGWNISGGFSAAGVGATAAYSSTSTDDDAIMVDVDGDGLVDRASISSNSKLTWLKNNGANQFVTPPPPPPPPPLGPPPTDDITPNSKDVNGDLIQAGSQSGGLVRINPLVRWMPTYGTNQAVTITGAIKKLIAGGNGVDVSIYKNDKVLWSQSIDAANLNDCQPYGTAAQNNTGCDPGNTGLHTTLSVGDALYFMSTPYHDPNDPNKVGREAIANQLSWDPVITYDNKTPAELATKEPYARPVYQFSQKDDFRLFRPEVQWVASGKGTVIVENKPLGGTEQAKEPVSDEVTIRILKHPLTNPTSSQSISLPSLPAGGKVPATSTAPIVLNASIPVEAGDSLTIEVQSDTPIDFSKLHLAPNIRYTDYYRNVSSSNNTQFNGPVSCVSGPPVLCSIAGDPETDSPVSSDLLYQAAHVSYPFPQYLGGPTKALSSTSAQTVNVSGSLTVTSTIGSSFRVLVQGVNQLYGAKQQYTVQDDGNGGTTATMSIPVSASAALQTGDELMVNVYGDQPVSIGPATISGVPVNGFARDWSPTAVDPNDGLPLDPTSGGFHRWAAGFYNGDLSGGFNPQNIKFPLDANSKPRFDPSRFFLAVPQHDIAGGERWSGPGGAYIAPGVFNASRGSSRLSNTTGGINTLRHAGTWNFDLSAQVVVAGVGVNQGRTRSDQDFFDLNGDRYPDSISADGAVRYGDGTGRFKWVDQNNDIKSLESLRRVDHGTLRANLGLDTQLINDTAADGTVRKMITTGFAIGTDYGLSSTNIDWIDVNGDGLPDAVRRLPTDSAKDVSHPFKVRLNYGYRLGTEIDWKANGWSTTSNGSATGLFGKGPQAITDLLSKFDSLGLDTHLGINGIRLQDNGTNNANIGVGGGVGGLSGSVGGGFSFGVSRTLTDMVDINGDGLPDQVLRVTGDNAGSDKIFLRVRLNLGDQFDTSDSYWTVPRWDVSIGQSPDFALSGDINDALGFRRTKSWTGSFSFKVCFILCVGASGFYENGSGWSHSNFEDLDGDGRPDMVFKSKDSTAVYAKLNQLPKELNLLTTVKRPLGGSFDVQYERAGNLARRDLPVKMDQQSVKYVMSRVDVADSQDPDPTKVHHYVRHFTYDPAGYHDRLERDDYGFANVSTERLNQNGTLYSKTELNYSNQDFYHKGLVLQEVVRDAANKVFNAVTRTYIPSGYGAACAAITPPVTVPPGSIFPGELTRTRKHFEGTTDLPNSTPPVSASETRTYDCVGNITDMVDGGDAGSNNEVVYHVDYKDPILQPLKIFRPSALTAKDHFNKTLRERRATYDNRGALLTWTEVVIGGVDPITGLPNTGDPATNPQWQYTYDAFGNVSKVVDPRGYTLNYLYDTTTKTHQSQVQDSFGYTSTSVTDLRFGSMASETDVNGSIANFNYDDFGRLKSVDGPYDVGSANHTIVFSYSETGVPTASGLPASNPYPAYAITSHRDVQHPTQPILTSAFVDGLARTIQTKKSLARDSGAGVELGMQVSGALTFDDQGRLVAQDQPFFDPIQPPTVMSPLPPPSSRVPAMRSQFDVVDRSVLTETPRTASKWATTKTTYGFGLLNGVQRLSVTVSDANVNENSSTPPPATPLPGYQHVELSGVRGNVLKVIEQNRLASSTSPTTLTTSYGYNPLNELLSVTDAKGNVTRATYDSLGRIVTLISPDAGRTDYQFDLSGNLAAKQTSLLAPGFQLIRYQYEFNRLKKVDYPNSADVSYDYGSATDAGPIGFNRASRIKQEVSEAGTKAFQYDALGNVNEETWTLKRIGASDTTERTFAYDYDSFGRLLAVYYPGTSREVVKYGYDNGGNLDTVTGVTATAVTTKYVQHIGYDEFEQKALLTVGNGVTTKYSYDPFTRRLTGIDASQRDPALVQANKPARPFQKVAYQYDPVGNVTQIANAAAVDPTQTGTVKVGPVTENFGYDDLYQLRTADGLHQTSATSRYHYGLSMTYDSINNLTQKGQLSETQTLSGSTVTQTTTRTDQTYASAFTYPTTVRPHAPTQIDDTAGGTTTQKRSFSYDANGNQSGWQRTTGTAAQRIVTYSDDNRVMKVTGKVGTTATVLQEDLYDGAGQRLVKRANESAQTAYFGQYLTVRDALPTTKHIYAGDMRVASKFVPNDAHEDCSSCSDRASTTYFHSDQLGSTTYATDEVQSLIAHEQYFPSGELWVDQTSDTAHTRQPYLFNGKELDVETGLYYFGARYYDPRIGIWTTPDPILSDYMQGATNRGVFLPQNLALYSYSWGNPVTIRDPNGKCPICLGALVGGVIGGGVYLARAAITGGDVTLRGAAGAVVGGAVSGTVAVLTGGTSLVAQIGAGAASGVAGGIASRAIETGDLKQTLDPKAVLLDAALGGVGGGAAYGIGKGVGALRAGVKGSGGAAADAAPGIRPATQQPTGGGGVVLQDAAGATPGEIAASTGGPGGGSRAGQQTIRNELLDEVPKGQPYKCWRCGQTTNNPANMHVGHRNVPTSKGGNLSPANACLEGAACNLSAGNRGAPTPGMDCASRGSCGAPYGRRD